MVLVVPPVVRGNPSYSILFSDLDSELLASGSGQTFPWSLGGSTGTVNVRATWTGVTAYPSQTGLTLRSDLSGTAEEPFVGDVTLTFDRPVSLYVRALNTVPTESLLQLEDYMYWPADDFFETETIDSYERLQFTSASPVTINYMLWGEQHTLPNATSLLLDPTSDEGRNFVYGRRGYMPLFSTQGFSDEYTFSYMSFYSQSDPRPPGPDTSFAYEESLYITITGLQAVPEPSAGALSAAAVLIGFARQRRRWRRAIRLRPRFSLLFRGGCKSRWPPLPR
jgi:hypothetical protein